MPFLLRSSGTGGKGRGQLDGVHGVLVVDAELRGLAHDHERHPAVLGDAELDLELPPTCTRTVRLAGFGTHG